MRNQIHSNGNSTHDAAEIRGRFQECLSPCYDYSHRDLKKTGRREVLVGDNEDRHGYTPVYHNIHKKGSHQWEGNGHEENSRNAD